MRCKAIQFSAPMVLAVLAGKKSQTRRKLKHQSDSLTAVKISSHFQWRTKFDNFVDYVKIPYSIGDQLWVRESININRDLDHPYVYAADNERVVPTNLVEREWLENYNSTCITPIFMPRWASRMSIEILDVDVHRLNQISDDQCISEGVRTTKFFDKAWNDIHRRNIASTPEKLAFKYLWETIHGKGSWDENPWVVAYTFSPISKLPQSD